VSAKERASVAWRMTEALVEPVVTCAECGGNMEHHGWKRDGRKWHPVFTCHPCRHRLTVPVIP
jgi:hypothetical protein